MPGDHENTLDKEGTVSFLPHRLNRQPIVVRGLTADELWITVGLSAVSGAVAGVPVAWLTSSIAMVPTMIVVGIAAGVFVGGGMLRRQKRGRPETWFYRQVQWWLRCHLPILSSWQGATALIIRSGYWTTRPTIRRGRV